MTTEDEFQAMLDANPDDHATRLVLADFLQERGDERAEGYRALGTLRLWPYLRNGSSLWYNAATARWNRIEEVGAQSDLPRDWWSLLIGADSWSRSGTRRYRSRREAEDAAAIAFAKLSADRRNELLNANQGVTK